MFSVSVLAIFISGIDLATIASLSIVFVVCRLLHAFFYLINQDALRSIVFVAGWA